MSTSNTETNHLEVNLWMFEPCPFTDDSVQLQWMRSNHLETDNHSTPLNLHLAHMLVEIEPKSLISPVFLDPSLIDKVELNNDGIITSESQEVVNNSFGENIIQLLQRNNILNNVNKEIIFNEKSEQDWIDVLKSDILLNYELKVKDLIFLLIISKSVSLATILLLREDNDILCSILRSETRHPFHGFPLVKELSKILFDHIGFISRYSHAPSEFRSLLNRLGLRHQGGEAGIELETCLGEEYAERSNPYEKMS